MVMFENEIPNSLFVYCSASERSSGPPLPPIYWSGPAHSRSHSHPLLLAVPSLVLVPSLNRDARLATEPGRIVPECFFS